MTGSFQYSVAVVLFLLIAGLVGADLLADAGSGAGALHLGAEGAGTLVALVGAGWFFRGFLASQAEARRWRARAEELLAGMGGTLQRQFAQWGLSPAEAEVALLLLKGLSFKEIASVRGTGERTAREQARAVYRKGGVGGRAELAAWFIEDLL
jgi:DNA-binding CsgD family transcriptional regulator